MTTWILVMVMAMGSAGLTTHHVEFNTLEACHLARKQLLEEVPGSVSKFIMCVKKGKYE